MTMAIWLRFVFWSGVLLLPTVGLPMSAVTDTTQPAPASSIEVEVRDGLLTLRATNAPLSEIIRAIGEEVGFETLVVGNVDPLVTRSLVAIPVEKGIRYLLDRLTYVMLYAPPEGDGEGRRVVTVHLYESSRTSSGLSVSPSAALSPNFVRDLLDANRNVRATAIRKLTRSGNVAAVDPLARVVREDDDPQVRGYAAAALGEIGEPVAVEALRAALKDNEQSVRIRAIRALSRIAGNASTELLGEVVRDESDRRSRLVAIGALGRRDSALAKSYLRAATEDADAQVRQAANRSLSSTKDAPRLDDDEL